MQINFEPDWDYMLEKAAGFYSREPYVNYNKGYVYKDYWDSNIEIFAGMEEPVILKTSKQGKSLYNPPHNLGIGTRVASRFEWRWEYQGSRYHPTKANVCVEWCLTKKEGYITDLAKPDRLRVIQPEEIWFCIYGTEEYSKVLDFWNKTWHIRRTHHD